MVSTGKGLLACDESQLATYKGLNLGPTFVHRNHGRMVHERDDKGKQRGGPMPGVTPPLHRRNSLTGKSNRLPV